MYHAIPPAYAVLSVISHCYSPLIGRLLTCYSPVRHGVQQVDKSSCLLPFDLHVLCTPPAFILSQDQTLNFCLIFFSHSNLPACLCFSYLFWTVHCPLGFIFSKGYCLFFNVLYYMFLLSLKHMFYYSFIMLFCQYFFSTFLFFLILKKVSFS